MARKEYIEVEYLDPDASEEEIKEYFFDLKTKLAPWWIQWFFRLVKKLGPEFRDAFTSSYDETRRKEREKEWS